jgi:hypothetical protein
VQIFKNLETICQRLLTSGFASFSCKKQLYL